MIRKITWMGEDWGYFQVVDFTEYANDLKEDLLEEEIEAYFKTGTFTPQEVEQNNGVHFLYGLEESLAQSEVCPPQFYTEDIHQVVVEELPS